MAILYRQTDRRTDKQTDRQTDRKTQVNSLRQTLSLQSREYKSCLPNGKWDFNQLSQKNK